MKDPKLSLLLAFLVFFLLALGCRGCPPKTDGPSINVNSSPPPAASPSVSKPATDSTVKRVEANVMAGTDQPLPLLTDDEPHDFLARAQVSTDSNGEALLKLSGCMRVYLFQTSSITYASCSKAESASGNARCQTGGTAVYNSECAGRIEQVIQTPTEDITPKGTWFSVTYLPDRRLTITLVLKGSVEVRPVTEIENRTLGEPITINAGQYSMTMPDAQANQQDYDTANLRQPKNVRDSLSEVNRYLKPWLDRIRKHAEEDKVDRQSYAFTADIDCDCEHLDAGLLNREYRLQCIRAEAEIWRKFYDTGEMGKCDSVAQGPNARPK